MNVGIKDIPIEERPRERLVNLGVENLSNEELLAILLKSGTKNVSVKVLASNILKQLDKLEKEGFIADVVIVDPPRKGVELQVLNYLQKKRVKKIIYVSCNPATLVKNF